MRKLLVGVGLVVVAAGSAVAVGQHVPRSHEGAKATHHMALQMCAHGNGSAEALTEHLTLMAAKLDLSTEQRTTVTRIATEACTAMAKYHEEIHAALTPEQREKMKELHSSGHEGGIHAMFKKLHGRR